MPNLTSLAKKQAYLHFLISAASTSTCSGSSKGVLKGLVQTGPGSQVGILNGSVKELKILISKVRDEPWSEANLKH